jgi:hypothetical protein
LDPALEQRLRDEAKSAGPGPSPYLRTRIMAEISSLHAEKMGPSRWRWVGRLAGGLAAVLVLLVALQWVGRQSGGRVSPIAGIHPPPSEVASVGEQTLAFTAELQSTVNDPFGSEIESLGTDAKRAATFLSACLPL